MDTTIWSIWEVPLGVGNITSSITIYLSLGNQLSLLETLCSPIFPLVGTKIHIKMKGRKTAASISMSVINSMLSTGVKIRLFCSYNIVWYFNIPHLQHSIFRPIILALSGISKLGLLRCVVFLIQATDGFIFHVHIHVGFVKFA